MLIWKKPKVAVELLVARLDEAKERALQGATTTEDANDLCSKLEECKKELKSMGEVFPDIKSWEKAMMEELCSLEKKLDNDLFKGPAEVLDHMTDGLRKLRESVPCTIDRRAASSNNKPGDGHGHQTVVWKEWADLGAEHKLLNMDVMSSFMRSFQCLSGAKMCSLCLSVFPMNSSVNKRPLIYWWIGEGLVTKIHNRKTAEEVGEEVFQELLDEGFVRPSSSNKSPSVSSFVIDTWIHRMLILIAKKNSFKFSSEWTPCSGKRRAFLCQENAEPEPKDVMTVFNLKEQYLQVKPEWLSKLEKVEVLQMGRWPTYATDHHIEVVDQTLFNCLGSQKHLKYLSLRGISRIETLPASISKLISLQILDLRACHNLEELPPAVSKLNNLTHLDVSQCYLLESMPKGLDQLVALQVLKGFVIGKADKNACKISYLKGLKNLRKLSIRVGNEQQNDQLLDLVNLSHLTILTISWGTASVSKGESVSLPPNLTKLDLRCVPFESVPAWLEPGTGRSPSNLVKLYIVGGKLKSLEPHIVYNWKVKFLRLRYLRIKQSMSMYRATIV